MANIDTIQVSGTDYTIQDKATATKVNAMSNTLASVTDTSGVVTSDLVTQVVANASDIKLLNGSDTTSGDLDIADEGGNVLARFSNGHIRTRYFDSAQYPNTPRSYWRDYCDTKKSEIDAADLALGAKGVSFFFPTDVHWYNNYQQSPLIMCYLNSICNKRDCICGGDIVSTHGTRTEKVAEVQDWEQLARGLNAINLVGNHDYNTSDQSSSTWDTYRITAGEFYRLADAESEKVVTWVENTNVDSGKYNEYYGYCDNLSQKVRYIFLDSGAVHQANWADTNLRMSTTQIAWMQSRITELAEGWSVVIFTHIFYSGVTSGSLTIHGIGTQIQTALDAIYDTASATIVGVICGHTHYDGYTTSAKGYPIICSTNDGRLDVNNDGVTSTQGTTTEQAFDIYYINTDSRTINTIRIGAGSNRSFTY